MFQNRAEALALALPAAVFATLVFLLPVAILLSEGFRAGGREEFGLPCDWVSAAGDHSAPPGEIDEDRQLGERGQASRPRFLRRDMACHATASVIERDGTLLLPPRGPVRAWKSAPFEVAATCPARIRKAPKRSPGRRAFA